MEKKKTYVFENYNTQITELLCFAKYFKKNDKGELILDTKKMKEHNVNKFDYPFKMMLDPDGVKIIFMLLHPFVFNPDDKNILIDIYIGNYYTLIYYALYKSLQNIGYNVTLDKTKELLKHQPRTLDVKPNYCIVQLDKIEPKLHYQPYNETYKLIEKINKEYIRNMYNISVKVGDFVKTIENTFDEYFKDINFKMLQVILEKFTITQEPDNNKFYINIIFKAKIVINFFNIKSPLFKSTDIMKVKEFAESISSTDNSFFNENENQKDSKYIEIRNGYYLHLPLEEFTTESITDKIKNIASDFYNMVRKII